MIEPQVLKIIVAYWNVQNRTCMSVSSAERNINYNEWRYVNLLIQQKRPAHAPLIIHRICHVRESDKSVWFETRLVRESAKTYLSRTRK